MAGLTRVQIRTLRLISYVTSGKPLTLILNSLLCGKDLIIPAFNVREAAVTISAKHLSRFL